VFPVPFNQIEFRTAWWQPEDQYSMIEQAESSQDSHNLVIRDIVHHQNDPATWVLLHQQIFDEFDKV